MLVHVLFTDPNGPYPSFADADCWDADRNALTFQGTSPVILHPPCGRWCGMAKMNKRRWGTKVGDDNGCFAFALQVLKTNGGVLEHPAKSLAWDAFGLPKPKGIGWHNENDLWVCEVWQSAYGHPCHKRTWLLYAGIQPPFDLNFTRDRSKATHQIGGGIHTGNRSKPRLNQRLTHITPAAFATELIQLAIHSQKLY